ADRNRSHWSTSKTPSYTKSVSWQHHLVGEYRNPKLMPLAFGGAEAPKSIYFKNIYNQLIHKIYKL
ncbi:hypothetical protein P2S10_10785, partial [Escherichia coli]